MEFCSKCGSYMKRTGDGFLCPRCGNKVHSGARAPQVQVVKVNHPSPIYVVDSSREEYERVFQTCPKCGNAEAYHWFSGVSGEHSGISRERTIEHFRCTECSHSWAKSA